MDEYTEATSGEETLVDFAAQRAESILAQLSGDLVVEAETESSMGDGSPNMGDGANAVPVNHLTWAAARWGCHAAP